VVVGEKMLEAFKYHCQLKKLLRQEEKCCRLYKTEIDKAKREHKKREEIESILSEQGFELQLIQEEMQLLTSRRLCRMARRLMVPLPKHGDEGFWYQQYTSGEYSLTREGIWELKKSIRMEKKGRREGKLLWLVALTGIIGAVTGLVAIIKS